MKYNDKHPEAVSAVKVFPEKMLGPHDWLPALDDEVWQTWTLGTCSGCHCRTSWMLIDDDVPVWVCSEECKAQYFSNGKNHGN